MVGCKFQNWKFRLSQSTAALLLQVTLVKWKEKVALFAFALKLSKETNQVNNNSNNNNEINRARKKSPPKSKGKTWKQPRIWRLQMQHSLEKLDFGRKFLLGERAKPILNATEWFSYILENIWECLGMPSMPRLDGEHHSEHSDTRRNLAQLQDVISSPLPAHWKIYVPITSFDDYNDVIYWV